MNWRNTITMGLATLTLSACSATTFNTQKTIIESPILQVNTDDNSVIIARKDEDAGIQDLRILADTTTYEELYAYIPSEKIWVELGEREKRTKVPLPNTPGDSIYRNGIYYDNELLQELATQYQDLVLYHYHWEPPHSLEHKQLNLYYLWDAHPSGNDIADYLHKSLTYPENNLVFRLVTPHGTHTIQTHPTQTFQEVYGVARRSLTRASGKGHDNAMRSWQEEALNIGTIRANQERAIACALETKPKTTNSLLTQSARCMIRIIMEETTLPTSKEYTITYEPHKKEQP